MQVALHSSDDTQFRIRLLAILVGLASLIALVSAAIFYNGSESTSLAWVIVLCVLAFVSSIVLFFLTKTNYAQIGVYAILALLLLVLCLADPLSGSLSGGTWILFQLLPPLGVLILRKSYVTIYMSMITAAALITVGMLQITGVISVHLLTSPDSLAFSLATQTIVMFALSSMILLVSRREHRTFQQLAHARHETQTQLDNVQDLLQEQQRLNDELAATMALMHEREQELLEQQQIQSNLRSTILQLAAPIVPVLPDVVVVPLVGIFDQARLRELQSTVATTLQQSRAKVAVLDLTGMQHIDTLFASALFNLEQSLALLGVRTIFVGINPEAAQTMVSLGIDTSELVVMPTLQEATLSLLKIR
jgi:rsbT co-antagonist protein RsbR